VVADGAGDEARGDRRAIIMQDRDQPNRIDAVLVDDQLPKLGVAVLLHYVHKIMVGDEARDAGMERESADAQAIELMPARFQSPIASSIAGEVEPK
jgi:hypothetical protein